MWWIKTNKGNGWVAAAAKNVIKIERKGIYFYHLMNIVCKSGTAAVAINDDNELFWLMLQWDLIELVELFLFGSNLLTCW